MDINFGDLLKPGIVGEKTEGVTDRNSAAAWGSGGLPVYATPAMVCLMESASLSAVEPLLPRGWSTVGTGLSVKHLSATPEGMEVRARAELLELEGRRLLFRVEAFDEAGRIGEGTHDRFIVENEKFLARARSKKAGG